MENWLDALPDLFCAFLYLRCCSVRALRVSVTRRIVSRDIVPRNWLSNFGAPEVVDSDVEGGSLVDDRGLFQRRSIGVPAPPKLPYCSPIDLFLTPFRKVPHCRQE